jgi:DNA-binding NtrC family response regulator
MDIKMPVMNGVEAFKKLKEIAPETPVIMMTAYAVEELIQEALREGAFGAFHKPIDFEKLVSSIERALPGGALIMVVDDNRELRANLRDVLTEKGYRVNLAQDGQVAVQMARENNPDVVLLDMKMPAMNGLETYLAIQDIRPDLVVIVITGYLGELGDLAQQAVEKGAYVCLEKPLDMDRLLELLHRLVELRSGGLLEEGTE